MIGKLKKGSSFGGCIRYVTGKDEAKIIASDGVLLGTNAEMTQSFELQRQLNPRIKKPVGHIALSFKPEDKPRLTDDFMAKIALEYMQMMGINDTQFIIVRHHNTDNPHCHIVYNRINNDGKLISDKNDYRRNEQVTKALKSKYGFTYGTDKSNTNTRKLRNAERAKYEIHNAVKSALRMADSWDEFKSELAKRGVHRAGTEADGAGHSAPSGQDGSWRAADSLHRIAAGRAVRPAMAGRGRRRGTAAHPADGGAHRADRRRDVPDGAATENGKFRTLDTHSKRDAADAEARGKAAGQLPADRRGDRP